MAESAKQDDLNQETEHDEQHERREVDRSARGQKASNRCQQRLRRLEQKTADRPVVRRIDPADQDPADNKQPQHGEQQLDDGEEEAGHGRPSIGLPQAGGRSPNRTRPTRTTVAPSSTATSKSSLMPIDSAAPICGVCLRNAWESSRSARNVGRARSGSDAGRPPVIRPRISSPSSAARPGASAASSSAAKPAFAGSASTLT